MNNQDDTTEKKPQFYTKHLFATMIFLATSTALVLVFTSMLLYYSSGASQLDLSSPNYVGIRDKIYTGDDFKDYSNVGDINSESIAEFRTLYNEKVDKIKEVDLFGGDPLDPSLLGIAGNSEEIDSL